VCNGLTTLTAAVGVTAAVAPFSAVTAAAAAAAVGKLGLLKRVLQDGIMCPLEVREDLNALIATAAAFCGTGWLLL